MASLPPANEVCEGYVFTPVCQSFCSQGGVASVHAGSRPTSPGADPLGADTAPQEQTPPPPEQTPWEQTSPREQTPPAQCMLGDTANKVGGTHPTGMHTCYLKEIIQTCSDVPKFM